MVIDWVVVDQWLMWAWAIISTDGGKTIGGVLALVSAGSMLKETAELRALKGDTGPPYSPAIKFNRRRGRAVAVGWAVFIYSFLGRSIRLPPSRVCG